MEDQDKTKLLKKIVESDGISGLSPLAIQLVELATDDRKGARDLADIIEKDPALTTGLLKLVGSAFFARPARVTSIPQAIVLLGFKRVRLMALTLSLRDTFPSGRKRAADYNQFWKTSLYRALIAQELAHAARLVDLHPDEAFVGGLLLGIGQLMLYRAMPDQGADFRGDEPLETVIAWEEEHFGIHHRKVGALVMQRWRFSDDIVECQRYFGDEALSPERQTLCKIVELARRATEVVFGATESLYQLHQAAQELLFLDKGQVDEILSRVFGKVQALGEQLRIEIDSEKDIIAVMEQANRALARLTASLDASIQGLVEKVKSYDQSLIEITQAAASGRQETLTNALDAVAHEIRNPLLAIGGFAERLARHATEKDQAQEYARIIAKESERLERIFREIVGYSQVYAPSFSEGDVISLVDAVIHSFEELFRERSIRVARDFYHKALKIPMDRDGLKKAVQQFIKNAAESVNETQGQVVLSIRPSESADEVVLTISDDGPPLSETIQNLLVDSNASGKAFDQGLGLPLAKKIIEAHRGRIELGRPQGSGNTVRIFLPTRHAQPLSPAPPAV